MSRLVLILALVLTPASGAAAQTGHVEGKVTDGAKPLVYANVVLRETYAGAMTDKNGYFRFRAPCGRQTLLVMHMGHLTREEPVAIRRDETTQVLLDLEPVEVASTPTVLVPWMRPEVDVTTHDKSGLDSLKLIPYPGPYPAETDPVRHGDLEFAMRYVLAQEGDSVVVSVIAEGRNVSDRAVTVCGCFSFWDMRYHVGPDDSSQWRIGPGSPPQPGTILTSLEVPPFECDGTFLKEERRTLRPGESVSRGMTLAFYPNAFREHPGELWVFGAFLMGQRGDRWEETEPVGLRFIKVPIRPIGMPIRP